MKQNTPFEYFPVVSLGKFTILMFATMGLYALYWMYRSWMTVEVLTGRSRFKLARTVLAMFFVFELFSFVRQVDQKSESPYVWNPIKQAWIFVLSGVVELLLVGIAQRFDLPLAFNLIIALVTLFIQFYAMYTVQIVMNRIAGDPFGQSNAKLTMQNHLWIVFGFYLWLNIVYIGYLDVTGQLPEPADAQEQMAPSNSTLM